jgi:hypothetical protein
MARSRKVKINWRRSLVLSDVLSGNQSTARSFQVLIPTVFQASPGLGRGFSIRESVSAPTILSCFSESADLPWWYVFHVTEAATEAKRVWHEAGTRPASSRGD